MPDNSGTDLHYDKYNVYHNTMLRTADVMSSDKVFQNLGPTATGDRSPTLLQAVTEGRQVHSRSTTGDAV